MLEVDSAQVLELVATSYDASLSDSWQARILRTWHGAFPTTHSCGVFEFESSDVEGGTRFERIFGWKTIGDGFYMEEAIRQQLAAPVEVIGSLFRKTASGTTSVQTGLGEALAEALHWRAMWKSPVVDSLGLIVRDPSGMGLCLGAGLEKITTLTPRESAVVAKVAVHIGAGHRLRRTQHAQPTEHADAILSPRGKLLHARNEAQAQSASLDDGLRRREAAKKTRHDAATLVSNFVFMAGPLSLRRAKHPWSFLSAIAG